MNSRKPKYPDEYKKWLKQEHEAEISDQIVMNYDSVTETLKKDFAESDFWVTLPDNLREFDSEYHLQKQYRLLLTVEGESKLHIKPFDSFLLKTFRKNILENDHWPNEPEGGWILPNNWYSRINDIIRTLVVVKYLDGVEFMVEKMSSLLKQHSMTCDAFFEAKEEGYYAAHLYAKREFEIPRLLWDTERIMVSIEIQITTQLQEAIRRLIHKYYEKRRELIKEEDIKWQWNYRNDEFTANYLGHILHYVEGMIMAIREKQKEEVT